MFVELREFQRDCVLPEKIATYETETGETRQYLTYGHHLGPVLAMRGIGGVQAEDFHKLVQAKYNLPRPGIHFVLTSEEIRELLDKWMKEGPLDIIESWLELDTFWDIADVDSILTYFWGGEQIEF